MEFHDHDGVMFFENAYQVSPCPIILESDEDRIEDDLNNVSRAHEQHFMVSKQFYGEEEDIIAEMLRLWIKEA